MKARMEAREQGGGCRDALPPESCCVSAQRETEPILFPAAL